MQRSYKQSRKKAELRQEGQYSSGHNPCSDYPVLKKVLELAAPSGISEYCPLVWGLPLTLPYISAQIDGCTVHNYNDGDLITCFDENVSDSVIEKVIWEGGNG